MQNVSQDTLKNLQVCLPDNNILELFNNKIKTIIDNIYNKMKENQELIKLRDYLLPLLMNGQIGFKN